MLIDLYRKTHVLIKGLLGGATGTKVCTRNYTNIEINCLKFQLCILLYGPTVIKKTLHNRPPLTYIGKHIICPLKTFWGAHSNQSLHQKSYKHRYTVCQISALYSFIWLDNNQKASSRDFLTFTLWRAVTLAPSGQQIWDHHLLTAFP